MALALIALANRPAYDLSSGEIFFSRRGGCNIMASLEQDSKSQTYLIRFRYGGREFKRSLGTTSAKLAHAMQGRIEKTLLLLRNGRLRIPPGCDPVLFILSDGKVLDLVPELVTVEEPFLQFKASRSSWRKGRKYDSNKRPALEAFATAVETQDVRSIDLRCAVGLLLGLCAVEDTGRLDEQEWPW